MGKKVVMMALACVLALLSGCRTKYVAVPEWHCRDSVRVSVGRDSVYLHDSVWVSLVSSGDTTYLTKYVTKYRYRDVYHRDTVAVVRVDSVRVPYPVEREAGLADRWRQWLLSACAAIVAAVLCYVVVWLVRAVRK